MIFAADIMSLQRSQTEVFGRAFYKKLVGVRGQRPCDTQQKHYINRLRLIVVSMLSHVSAQAQHCAPRKSEQVSTVKNHPPDNFCASPATYNWFSRTFSLAKRFSSSPNERLTIKCFALCGVRPEFHSGLDNFLKKIE